MVDIDVVYQKVLALANKEQRGYITPQEFNLFADKAQKEIYSSYFHDYKTGFFKPKSETESFDDLEMTQQKLDYTRAQWISTCKVTTTADGRNLVTFNMPNSYKVASVFLRSTHSVSKPGGGINTAFVNPQVEVKRVERNDVLNMLANPLTAPTIKRPIFVNRNSGAGSGYQNTYEIYPMATYTGPVQVENFGGQTELWSGNPNDGGVIIQEGIPSYTGPIYTQADPIDGIGGDHYTYNTDETDAVFIKGADLLVDYWKTLSKPNWAYVVVKQKALYNSGASNHFDLHPCEEEPLVMKILALAGVTIEKPQLTKMAMGMDAKTKQEQND
jgi:hypothetical protein